jgi:probable HAF family extracellular repeat protein
VVGDSIVDGRPIATEWSNGQIIDLGGLPGFRVSDAIGINKSGQVVGYSIVGAAGLQVATEWSNGRVINLGALPGFRASDAIGINGAGQVVGSSSSSVAAAPEPSTWAMMLLGFAGLGFAGWQSRRRSVSVVA